MGKARDILRKSAVNAREKRERGVRKSQRKVA